MKPVALTTQRLVLDQLTLDDVDLVTGYCQDPLFEEYLTTPWPYTRDDALGFIEDVVPRGWKRNTEFTWAIRHDGEFCGVVGYRAVGRDIGFWLGSPHRGFGYMTEATNAVLDWIFGAGREETLTDGTVLWECAIGNAASVSTARKAGFTYTGEAPTTIPRRDGTAQLAWHGVIRDTDSRESKAGWPV